MLWRVFWASFFGICAAAALYCLVFALRRHSSQSSWNKGYRAEEDFAREAREKCRTQNLEDQSKAFIKNFPSASLWRQSYFMVFFILALLVMLPQWISIVVRSLQPFDHIASLPDQYFPMENFTDWGALQETLRFNFSEKSWLFRPFAALFYQINLIVFGSEYWMQYSIRILSSIAVAYLSSRIVYRCTGIVFCSVVCFLAILLHPAPSNLYYYAPEVFAELLVMLSFTFMFSLEATIEAGKSPSLSGMLFAVIAGILAAGTKEWGFIYLTALAFYLVARLAPSTELDRSLRRTVLGCAAACDAMILFTLVRVSHAAAGAEFSVLKFFKRFGENLFYLLPIQPTSPTGFAAQFPFWILVLAAIVLTAAGRYRKGGPSLVRRFLPVLTSPVILLTVASFLTLIFISFPAQYPPRTTPRYVYPVLVATCMLASIGLDYVRRVLFRTPFFSAKSGRRAAELAGIAFCVLLLVGLPGVSYSRIFQFNTYIEMFHALVNKAIDTAETEKGRVFFLKARNDGRYHEIDVTIRSLFEGKGRRLLDMKPGLLRPFETSAAPKQGKFWIVSSLSTDKVLDSLKDAEGIRLTRVYQALPNPKPGNGMPFATDIFVHIARFLGMFSVPFWESGTLTDLRQAYFQMFEFCPAHDLDCGFTPALIAIIPRYLRQPKQADGIVLFGSRRFRPESSFGQIMFADIPKRIEDSPVRLRLVGPDGESVAEIGCMKEGECKKDSDVFALDPEKEYALQLFLYEKEWKPASQRYPAHKIFFMPISPLYPPRRIGGFVPG